MCYNKGTKNKCEVFKIMVNIDLTKVNKHSMASVLTDNTNELTEVCKSGSVNEIYNFVAGLFEKESINTKASNRLLNNIKSANSATKAMFIVYNSMMAGSGLSVV